MNETVLSAVLARANACPPANEREEFYALKDHILSRFGAVCPPVVQKVTKPCWGYPSHYGCSGEWDCKCEGTGIYSQTFWLLKTWEWCGRTFHKPIERLPSTTDDSLVTIHGVIEKRRTTHARNCYLALMLIFCPWCFRDSNYDGQKHGDRMRRVLRIVAAIGQVPKSAMMPEPEWANDELPF